MSTVRHVSLLAGFTLALLGACSRKSAPTESFTCQRLQERVAQCEGDALALIKRRMGDGALENSEMQYRMFERRFRARVANRAALQQCEKTSDSERAKRMRECWARSGCDAFAACMFELPE